MLDCRDWISISQSPDIPSSPKGMQVHKGSSGILSNYVHETNLNLPTSASFPLSVSYAHSTRFYLSCFILSPTTTNRHPSEANLVIEQFPSIP